MSEAPFRLGVVVGEASGDALGAGLIEALRARIPALEVTGIGGPQMEAAGCRSWHPMERLAVMGLVDPLKRLPELLSIRRNLKQRFLAQPPDVFVGIDAPDFNLDLEVALRRGGVRTAHYVSPSVWAWRRGRIRKISRAVDLMLTLFPFEARFYREHDVPVHFTGHPLADRFPLEPDHLSARRALGLDASEPVLGLLPGSRGGELAQMARPFAATASWCQARVPGLKIIIPAAGPARRAQLEQLLGEQLQRPDWQLLEGRAHEVLAAADSVLLASGTTSLEALLQKTPMVVAYRLGRVSWAILSRLVHAPWISLPNLLAGRELVPERLQDDVRPEVLGPLVLERLTDPGRRERLISEFTAIHRSLRRDASANAAGALLELAGRH